MSISGLFAKTARLPMVDFREPEKLIGSNTYLASLIAPLQRPPPEPFQQPPRVLDLAGLHQGSNLAKDAAQLALLTPRQPRYQIKG